MQSNWKNKIQRSRVSSALHVCWSYSQYCKTIYENKILENVVIKISGVYIVNSNLILFPLHFFNLIFFPKTSEHQRGSAATNFLKILCKIGLVWVGELEKSCSPMDPTGTIDTIGGTPVLVSLPYYKYSKGR